MLPSERNDYYKYYVEQLGLASSEQDLKQEGFIPAIKDLIAKGTDVNLKDNKGNSLLHYLVSNEVVRSLSEEGRKEGDFTHVLDVPFMIASYQKKLNPFVTDANGMTASCLAAYYGNMKDHAMLMSFESNVNHRRTIVGLCALSEIMAHGEYMSSSRDRVWMSNEQTDEFNSARATLLTLRRVADGKTKEMD